MPTPAPLPSFIHPNTGKPIKLGRTRLRRNSRSYLRASAVGEFLAKLPDDAAPTVCDYTGDIDPWAWGMMLNDTLGDCTIACIAHMIQAWTAMAGHKITVPDSAVLKAYENFDGYVPKHPETDQGGDILTVCQDWESLGIAGHKISGFGEVNMTEMRWKQALWAFGGLNCGVVLPVTAQNQLGGTWDIVGDGKRGDAEPGSWGGHCINAVGYDLEGVTFVTWGETQRATWRFVMRYFDECVACLSVDWTKAPVPASDLVGILQQIRH